MPHRTQIGFLFVSLVIQQSVAKFRNYTSKLWYRRDLTRFFRKIQICPVTCEIWRNFSAKIAPSVFGVFYFLPPFIFNLFFHNFISWCHSKNHSHSFILQILYFPQLCKMLDFLRTYLLTQKKISNLAGLSRKINQLPKQQIQ